MVDLIKYVSVTFTVSRLPHPQSDHLGSRTRSLGKLYYYANNTIRFWVPATTVENLVQYVKEYLESHGATILSFKEDK